MTKKQRQARIKALRHAIDYISENTHTLHEHLGTLYEMKRELTREAIKAGDYGNQSE